MIPTPTPIISVTVNNPDFQTFFDIGFDPLAIGMAIAIALIWLVYQAIKKISK